MELCRHISVVHSVPKKAKVKGFTSGLWNGRMHPPSTRPSSCGRSERHSAGIRLPLRRSGAHVGIKKDGAPIINATVRRCVETYSLPAVHWNDVNVDLPIRGSHTKQNRRSGLILTEKNSCGTASSWRELPCQTTFVERKATLQHEREDGGHTALVLHLLYCDRWTRDVELEWRDVSGLCEDNHGNSARAGIA